MGEAYEYCRHHRGQALVEKCLDIISDLEDDLDYRFKNKLLLLEALTHRSAGKALLEVNFNYEKLEVLGDSILDYLCNYGLLRYTMFERYLKKDPTVYQLEEDYVPGDAH